MTLRLESGSEFDVTYWGFGVAHPACGHREVLGWRLSDLFEGSPEKTPARVGAMGLILPQGRKPEAT